MQPWREPTCVSQAGEESEPASLVLQLLPNESARQSDGTFVQFYGELGGPKGSLPELDQALSSRARWEPPPPRTTAHELFSGLQVAALGGLFGSLLCVGWIVRCCTLTHERQQRARPPPRDVR